MEKTRLKSNLSRYGIVAIIMVTMSVGTMDGSDDRARIRQAVIDGRSEDLKTLLQLSEMKALIAQKNDNDLLYLAIEKMCGNRYNGSDASVEELKRAATCDERQAEIIKILLENGATANINGAKPRPPALLHAVRLRAPACVKVLLSVGADANIMYNGNRPLPLAARNGATAPEIVRLLLEGGANANGGDKGNGHPLVAILDYGKWDYDVNDARREKINGRYELLRKNSQETIELLLQAGADPSIGLRTTLLHTRPKASDSELIPMFVKAGALKQGRYTRDLALADLLRAKVDRSWAEAKYTNLKRLIENGGP